MGHDPRILIVRLGAVGDVVRTLPLLHALRREHPGARLGWLVEEPSSSLLRELPALDEVHVLRRRPLSAAAARPWRWPAAASILRELRAELRAREYRVVLDAHGILKAAIAGSLAGGTLVGLGPGGSKEGAHVLHARSHAFPAHPMSRIRRALYLGAAEGLLGADPVLDDDDPRVDFGLDFPPARTAAVAAFVARDPRPLVVFVPFASAGGQAKRWPIDRHVAAAALLARDGVRAVVAWGSRREHEEASSAVTRGGEGRVELAPPTDLVELAALLRAARLVVTGDTGPMHVAAAVRTRVLALFGPSDPVVNRPWGQGHSVMVARPLATLDVATVAARAREMLAGG